MTQAQASPGRQQCGGGWKADPKRGRAKAGDRICPAEDVCCDETGRSSKAAQKQALGCACLLGGATQRLVVGWSTNRVREDRMSIRVKLAGAPRAPDRIIFDAGLASATSLRLLLQHTPGLCVGAFAVVSLSPTTVLPGRARIRTG
jgi:hypothetical protein